ncbi:g11499 [Coccomyxa elongata]
MLATFSVVLADKEVPLITVANNALGSLVALENSILAPLSPFGRKLHTFIPAVPNPDPNVVKANAIGSILYTAGGLYNTKLYQQALTGTTGRKLSQVPKGPDGFPDPYGFIPKANLVASIFKGQLPKGRKLHEAESGLSSATEKVHSALGFNRKSLA